MSWRSVLVSQPARLSLKDRQLVISQEQSVTVPLEDLETVVIESPQVTMTGQLLSEMAQQGVGMVVCDERHLPAGLYLPLTQTCRPLETARLQLTVSLPFKKNCWRHIIAYKIFNQAQCLEFLGIDGACDLLVMSKNVKSGDSTNLEAQAARLYFDRFMPGSHRQSDTHINAALNYGYAVMRAAVTRQLVIHGFLPLFGIHHSNDLNNFNLSDDLMEVFRPLVDLWAGRQITRDEEKLSLQERRGLAALLYQDVLIQGEQHQASYAIDLMTESFRRACEKGDPELLVLPRLLAGKA